MVIKRIYNNNVAMVEDEGVERIAIGRGITFGRSRGDELDTSAVEKVFTLDDPDSLNRLERLIKGIPSEYLSVAEDIVAMLRAELGSDVDDNVLIALTDHISMAIERERAEVPCDNPLLMETRRFYKKEFALALRAQDIIEDRLGIRVSEGEVGFITLHIVNATMQQRADHLMLSISMINEILGIVAEAFDLVYDEESIQYERFLRHLQFFAQRVLDKSVVQSEDTFLFHLGKDQYPAAFECTERIGEHVASTYGCAVADAEKGYLVYHIMNLVNAARADAPAAPSAAE
ncbi:PRD domain-containing protein [Collinsella sp. AF08-23]|uniref:PRD domain-containing protein n=1 Tax=Collinsella sp. AF08-23 TaxID=2292211 RepID=UPI000E48952A|nr:PRD domain-containing protein [Collinsella sp. AF08-23]RHS41553.1 PRD domain-containing protein [Collinsella sp. AF08-23]